VVRLSIVANNGLYGSLDHSLEVLQIYQYLLKYTEFSFKIFNISLLTLCNLVNKDLLKYPSWNLLRLMLHKDPHGLLSHLLAILRLDL